MFASIRPPSIPTPVPMLAALIAGMLIRVMMPPAQMENAWLAGQVPTILPYFINQKMPPASTSTNPDLTFVSIDSDSRLPDRHALEKFPRSQY